MDIRPDEIDVHGNSVGAKWYASKGLSETGHGVVINYLVNSESEIAPLAHAVGILNNVSMHEKAKYIGTREDFNDSEE